MEVRIAKNEYWGNKGLEVQQALEKGDSSLAFKTIKQLAGASRFGLSARVRFDGKPARSERDVVTGWAKHLQVERGLVEVGKRDCVQEICVPESIDDGEVNHLWPYTAILHSILKLKKNKAVPAWSAPAEVWQSVAPQLADLLGKVFQSLHDVQLPESWRSAQIAWLPKPGKPHKHPSDFRDIMLLDPLMKSYCYCLYRRVEPVVRTHILDTTFGYLRGKSTAGAIAFLDVATLQLAAAGRSSVSIYFDYRQAFYSINRQKLYDVLEHFLGRTRAWLQARRRHEGTLYVLDQGAVRVCLLGREGVIVGDVLGPLLFFGVRQRVRQILAGAAC